MRIPRSLVTTCRTNPEWSAWLARLPDALHELEQRWELTLESPFDGPEVSCAWVAPATLRDGTHSVLKVGMPHFEGEHELEALRFLDGDPTVRLLRADDELNAMLLEQCRPGSVLRDRDQGDQDVVIAQLLRRFWRVPTDPHPFRPLAAMTAQWSDETRAQRNRWPDAGLVEGGLRLFAELPLSAPANVLLATDLHAGNVLAAQREPWLVIDPKPFVGDSAYDATQHLFNCRERLRQDPDVAIRRFADLLEVDGDRVRLWMFARLAAEPRTEWDDDRLDLARRLT